VNDIDVDDVEIATNVQASAIKLYAENIWKLYAENN